MPGMTTTRARLRGGIDLGGTKIQAVVMDGRNVVRGSARGPTPREGGPPAVAVAMADTLRAAVEASGASPSQLLAVGVGAPGAVDFATGVVAHSGNIAGWQGSFPLGATLSADLGVPVRIGNDVDVATEAEYRLGAGKEYRSVLGVFWGTGVGGGLILNGQRWTGRGAAAEIGHVVVVIDGLPCGCGRRGCMEAYAGRGRLEERARAAHEKGHHTSLFHHMERRGKDRLSSGVWAAALEDGDKLATHLIDEAMAALGAGVASANNLLDVDAIILGGGLGTRFGQPFADRLSREMLPHLFVSDRPPPVLVAALGDLGGAVGAALGAPVRGR
jgi:glucokinase